ncbi:hypothetical protein VTO42DRAFT_3862 [Malbranchea cinnamomea]
MLEKTILFVKLVGYSIAIYADLLGRTIAVYVQKFILRKSHKRSRPQGTKPRNIVIIGASFAGYHTARLLSASLPADGSFRIVVIEPNSHFNFTWVLPRFCVVSGHEHKAFIPYGPYLSVAPEGCICWIKDRVTSIERTSVKLRSGEEVPYDFLVVATGSGEGEGLPSRVGSEEKRDGIELLKDVQACIRDAKTVVVVGGGAAGVELATDAKSAYPGKHVVLVHSRNAVMHRFGPEFQQAALKGLTELGVEVILGERLIREDKREGIVTLSSGRTVECDYLVRCTGQKPASQVLAGLSPSSISESGHIRVKPTLQIADEAFHNIYTCGDVANTGVRNPNARSAYHQAKIVADNIALAMRGKPPRHTYTPHWADRVIKLTLGLNKSITHFEDGKTELLFHAKETDPALMSGDAWRALGAKPFDDNFGPASLAFKYEGEEETKFKQAEVLS